MKFYKFFCLPLLACAMATCSIRADDATNAPVADAPIAAPAAGSSAADSLKPAMSDDDWHFGITVPLWAPKIDGNATVRGHQENVSVSFNDLRQHLHSIFSIAFGARKGKFDFYGDVGYMKFSASQSFADGHIKSWAGLKFLVSDAGAGYVLIKTESEHPFVVEGTAGVRYWYVSMPVTLSDDAGGTLFAGSKTWNVVDPVLGLRGSQYFTRKFHLDFSADGGGFDINNDTDWTWSATGMLTYDFCKYFSLSAGYKALALDESNGSGSGKNGVNLIFNGALVTLNFRF